jgi:hypothetical protein
MPRLPLSRTFVSSRSSSSAPPGSITERSARTPGITLLQFSASSAPSAAPRETCGARRTRITATRDPAPA